MVVTSLADTLVVVRNPAADDMRVQFFRAR
jgi:hypothetical protein